MCFAKGDGCFITLSKFINNWDEVNGTIGEKYLLTDLVSPKMKKFRLF